MARALTAERTIEEGGQDLRDPKNGYLKGVILPAAITVLVVMLLAWALRIWADGDHGHDGADGAQVVRLGELAWSLSSGGPSGLRTVSTAG